MTGAGSGRGAPASAWAARSLLMLCIAMLVATLVGEAFAPRPFPQVGEFSWSGVPVAVAIAGFMTVGALLVVRVPGNRLGWILVAFALLMAVSPLAYQYAIAGLPGWDAAAWVSAWAWVPPIAVLAEAMLCFPNGWPPRRWRWVEWAAAAGLVTSLGVGVALWPRRDMSLLTMGDAYPGFAGVLAGVALPLVFGSFVAAAVSLLVRLRRARDVERQQLKWLVAAVAVAAAGLVAFAVGDVVFGGVQPLVGDVLSTLGMLSIPAAIWIAVTRHRLFDVDRLISRTLSYAVVTVLLTGVYAGIAVLPVVAFDVRSHLLVAAATLAAAALFVPVRRRVQAEVDRRFNRARYDAVQVVERFGDRLRDELDLDGLTVDLGRVVASTVQPAHVSLWLRGDGTIR